MTEVIIGVDPHKGSHTAYAVDTAERRLGQVRVQAVSDQVDSLVQWSAGWPQRTWAIEGACGLGHLLAQQLLACGERVVDVQPKLAARVRLLDIGQVNKNDPNDARSVAIAALRSARTEIAADGHAAVVKLWARRHRDLSRARNRVACRLHAVLCELVPGGFTRDITALRASRVLAQITVHGPVAAARLELAHDLLTELRGIDEQRTTTKRRLARIVADSATSIVEVYGVGPVVAATVLGYVGDIHRFPTRDRFAAYNGTAPIEASSGNRQVHRLSRRGNRQLNHAIHIAAVCQIRHRHTTGRAYYDRKTAEGMTPKSALRALKRRISDALYAHLIADAKRLAHSNQSRGPGGHTGNDSASSAAGSHPGPALRTSHSRADSNPTTTATPSQPPTHRRHQPSA